MSIPLPENTFTPETLAFADKRRTQLKAGCPRHPGTELTFWKELLVGTEGDMHLVATALYDCADMLSVALDDPAEEPRYKEC